MKSAREIIAPSMQPGRTGEVVSYFLRLGLLAFGGAAGQIAMMRRELVQRRQWLSEQDFLDLFGIMNLVPGPSSTETVIGLGYLRAGWPALILAGAIFILPAMLMILALSWAYVRFGTMPAAQWILYGLNPIVIAIIADALWNLGRAAIKTVWLVLLALAAIVLYFRGVSVIAILFGAIALTAAIVMWQRRSKTARPALYPATMAKYALPVGVAAGAMVPFTISRLFWTFVKIGATAYGSGYVLLAFLREDFVVRLRWLTDKQLLDSIAVGQITPGPVFASATFIGYVTGGFRGALLATLGIFLPSFAIVAILIPLIPKLKGSPYARIFLDSINVTTVGLMGAVSWQLARGAVVDIFTAVEALVAFVILLRFRISSAWLILAGMAIGVAFRMAMR
jgi:chromate transporter